MPMPTHINGRPVKTGSWVQEEDDLLSEWQAKLGNRWSAVAKKIPGRTGQQCAQRWRHKVNPNIKKEKWTEEEDEALVALVAEHGNAWADIARRLDGRTDQQCMGRWRRHLDPAIRRDAWATREDVALTTLYKRHGSQWSAIAKCISGRTAQQCRARWFQLEADGDADVEAAAAAGHRCAKKPAARRRRLKNGHSKDSDGEDSGESAGAYLGRSEELEDIQEEEEYVAAPPVRKSTRPARASAAAAAAAATASSASSSGGASADSSEGDEAPSSYSTPLKTAYSRAMSGSRASTRSRALKGGVCTEDRRQSTGRSFRTCAPHICKDEDGLATLSAAAAFDTEGALDGDDDVEAQLACGAAAGAAASEQGACREPEGASPALRDVPPTAAAGTPASHRGARSGGCRGPASPLFLSPLRHGSSRASESHIICASTAAGGGPHHQNQLFSALQPSPLEDGFKSPEEQVFALTPGADLAGASPLGRPSCGGGGSGAPPSSQQQRRPPFPRSRTRSRTTPRQALPAGVHAEEGCGGGAGDALVSPGSWRRQASPGVNLLALLQSPHPPARTDLFMSPGLKRYNLLTPEWAKRKFARDGDQQQPQRGASTASPLGRAALPDQQPEAEDAATCARPVRRGNVARRLNIEQALRRPALAAAQSSASREASPGKAVRRQLILTDAAAGAQADPSLGSPAKKCKVEASAPKAEMPRAGSGGEASNGLFGRGGSTLHTQAQFLQRLDSQRAASTEDDEDACSDCISVSKASHHAQLHQLSENEDSVMQESFGCVRQTDKENSACNAFEHLSMVGVDAKGRQIRLMADTPAAKIQASKEVNSTGRSSADVRQGLIALLDEL